jgi:hypothetical protein
MVENPCGKLVKKRGQLKKNSELLTTKEDLSLYY